MPGDLRNAENEQSGFRIPVARRKPGNKKTRERGNWDEQVVQMLRYIPMGIGRPKTLYAGVEGFDGIG